MKSVHACDYLPERTRLWATRDGHPARFLGQVECRPTDGVPALYGGPDDGIETVMLHDGERLEVDRRFRGQWGPRASLAPYPEPREQVAGPSEEEQLEDLWATRFGVLPAEMRQ